MGIYFIHNYCNKLNNKNINNANQTFLSYLLALSFYPLRMFYLSFLTTDHLIPIPRKAGKVIDINEQIPRIPQTQTGPIMFLRSSVLFQSAPNIKQEMSD